MYWDPRAGPQNLDKYPPEYDIGMPQFMQVYSNYQANKKQRFYSFGDLEKTIYTYRRSGDDEPFLILETTLEGKEDYIEHTLKEYSTKIGVNGLELSDDSRTADQIFHSLQS